MRVYLPAALSELALSELSPRAAHAVTPALRRAFPDEDEEGLEYLALLLAAGDSLDLAQHHLRRVAVAADVTAVELVDDDVPSRVHLAEPVSRAAAVSAHVDEAGAAADVRAALAGDADALERLGERDLLWYDVTEFEHLAADPP